MPERNSLTEINATSQAETTSDRMATIPQNLGSEGVIHNSLQVLSSTINMDLPSRLERKTNSPLIFFQDTF